MFLLMLVIVGPLQRLSRVSTLPLPPHLAYPARARSKTRFSEARKPRRISFPRFSTPSFPFCTIPKTENSEMKTSECCFKLFLPNPEFSILHCTQNGKLGDENLGMLFQAFLPNSEFFQLRVFHFTLYPKRKTRSWKPRSFL